MDENKIAEIAEEIINHGLVAFGPSEIYGYAKSIASGYISIRDQIQHADTTQLHELLELRAENEVLRSAFRELEPCGHAKNFLIGDDHGHFTCTVCSIADLTRKLEEARDLYLQQIAFSNKLDVDLSGICKELEAATTRSEAAERATRAVRDMEETTLGLLQEETSRRMAAEQQNAAMREALKSISDEGFWGTSNDPRSLVKILDEHKETADRALAALNSTPETTKCNDCWDTLKLIETRLTDLRRIVHEGVNRGWLIDEIESILIDVAESLK